MEKSYSYDGATNCDFPGDNIIPNSCVSTKDAYGCAYKCAEKFPVCKAFIATTNNRKSYLCCLKQEINNQQFSRVKAKQFTEKGLQSTCGIVNPYGFG